MKLTSAPLILGIRDKRNFGVNCAIDFATCCKFRGDRLSRRPQQVEPSNR